MRLEEFVKNNKAAFDSAVPDPKIWNKIEADLHPAKQTKLRWLAPMAVAASTALVVMFSTYWAYEAGKTDGMNFAQEKIEIEQFYEQKLSNQMAKLAGLSVGPEVKQDLDNMDPTLFDTPPKNEVEKEAQLRAIIQNFEARISIIEKVLEHAPTNTKSVKNERNDQSI